MAEATTLLRTPEDVEEFLGALFDDHEMPMFRGATFESGTWRLELEFGVEVDTDGDDDLSRPLWLVPTLEWFRRVSLTISGGSFEEDWSGLEEEDREHRPHNGWLVDEWTASADDDDRICVRVGLREVGAPELVVRTAVGGVVEATCSEPETRPAELAIDPDRVTFTFSEPATAPGLAELAGATWRECGELAYELHRADATPEAFVALLRRLGEIPSFVTVSSGEVPFSPSQWLDYVTPQRRPSE